MTDPAPGRYTALDPLCERYSKTHDKLREKVEELQHQILGLKRRHLADIRKAASAAAQAKGAILDHICDRPDLFPPEGHRRSVVLHGVKAGKRQAPGALRWNNQARVVARIRELYDDQVGVLIKITETPSKAALADLAKKDPKALRALGVTIEGQGEYAFVAIADNEIDKWVDRLLDEDGLQDEDAALAG